MAAKEIEEADLLSMQHVAGVVDAVMKSPGRNQFLSLVKQAKPDLSIPEVDAAAPIIAAVNAQNKKLDEFLAAQQQREREAEESRRIRDIEQQWSAQETELRREGWRDAGIDQVRKFASENGITSLRIAADAYERRNPQPSPVDSRSAGWNLFNGPAETDTYIKDMMEAQGSNESRLDKEIADTLAEIRSGY